MLHDEMDKLQQTSRAKDNYHFFSSTFLSHRFVYSRKIICDIFKIKWYLFSSLKSHNLLMIFVKDLWRTISCESLLISFILITNNNKLGVRQTQFKLGLSKPTLLSVKFRSSKLWGCLQFKIKKIVCLLFTNSWGHLPCRKIKVMKKMRLSSIYQKKNEAVFNFQ